MADSWRIRHESENRLGADRLAALAAVVEFGSFDAAAERLHVTPSAVSQRIKALEQRVAQVLVVREKPCKATGAGIPLVRLAAQTALLESEALGALGRRSDAERLRVAIAVNADSMATWRASVPGCRVESLGVMRYVPVARPGYVERYLPDGFTAEAVAAAPSLAWNRDDALQDMLLRKAFRRGISRPVHYVPTAEGFGAAVRAGVGWGMFPEQLAVSALADGSFVRTADAHLDVPLYWQCWKLNSPVVEAVTTAVRSSASNLHRARPARNNRRR